MPATYAHYVFGKKVLKKLPESIRQEVRQGEDAFLLGLHGPDLLFYYYPVSKNRINQQGVAMHQELAAEFFDRGRSLWRKEQDPALRAYLYGFLCHFILDSECHPFINQYVEEKGLGHLTIETEFDRYLMAMDGRALLSYVPVHHLISRANTRKQISRMFDQVTPGQIGACIWQFRQVITFFVCRNPIKRLFLKIISRVMGQDNGIGGLIMDGKVHPFCAESDHFLEDRMEHAVLTAVDEIKKYARVLRTGGLLSDRLYQNYEESI
ncbi:MAG: zinc dependent phospholipase C family protein [Lachnospiraceae bacterium]|nr:zinc dependent phospholipase C family protein [Lachnospiraceae bacterium]